MVGKGGHIMGCRASLVTEESVITFRLFDQEVAKGSRWEEEKDEEEEKDDDDDEEEKQTEIAVLFLYFSYFMSGGLCQSSHRCLGLSSKVRR